jgi:nitrogen-specific signal transduction histidine kinase/CheY-like chemotaxis protein
MTVPSLVDDLTRAFATARVEMMAVEIDSATVIGVTEEVLKRWNCRREDVFNRPLAKFGTGTLTARYVEGDEDKQKIEVTYSPPLGNARSSLFSAQSWNAGDYHFMVLIGQHGDKAEAEEAIQNAHRLKLALRSGGYALWDYDYRTGKTFNSPELYDLLGFERSDPKLDFDRFNERVHPDDLDKTLDEKIRSAPFGADLFQTKYRVKAANGEYLWIESVAGVVRDPASGKPAKTVGLCRNINDQMNVLEKIRMSERNLKRSQAAAQLGSFILRIDAESSKLSSEMVALLGLDDALMPPTLDNFQSMIEEGRERFREGLEKARDGGTATGIEITVRLRSGETSYFQCNVGPERDPGGRIQSIFGTCQCITERKLLEKKFLQAQKMEAVGQLTGGIAHDFNNLLMVVMGNLQLVEQLVRNDDRAVKRIRAAIEAADKGSELTKRLLAFSRQQTLQKRDVSINELIIRMHDMLRQAVGERVEIKMIPGDELAAVRTDATMLETAILNLAINARDAMQPAGGSLIIETQNITLDSAYCRDNEEIQPGDYVEIAVTDTGCGISKDNIDKVFQPFFTTKPPEAGSGLGLSMTYGFVKQSGGHIKLYSEIGHGTTVKLYLPALKTERPAQATGPEAQAPDAQRRPVVLVVEDNEQVRSVAAAMIEDMGIETIQAASGAEGLRIIERRPDIDLVLSDVIMSGGINGPELAARALRLKPGLKVLLMSGYAPGSVRQTQDLPDTIDLVNKPFTRNDLAAKVRRALAA